MLDINFIRNNPIVCKQAAADKNFPVDIDRLLDLDTQLRDKTAQIEKLRAERNTLSKGKPDETGIARVRAIKPELSTLEIAIGELKAEFDALMLTVPSVPLPDVPIGKGEEGNVEVRRVGDIPQFDFAPRDHVELCDLHDMMDIPRGVKCAGSRSYFLKNMGTLLESAILRMTLDVLCNKGFTPMSVPVLVKEHAMAGTGYFPIGRESAYYVGEDELYLVGTSEVALVSYHSNEILERQKLPLRYTGQSTCFRREAGTYGKDTRGLYRVHQFQKVEQVVFCTPDMADDLHHEILGNTETILQALELPYRVSLACTGEIGLGQIKKHEVETWMPSREAYCETHSCSTMGDFQARRSNIRYRDIDSNTQYCWTLNNTGIATPRILIPLLENHQHEDGSIYIPVALRPYLGGQEVIS
ncbi:MAG: serine--tRNA ligase [Oscillospiraceae bacterium]|nr:serine--tRNA ligase [Oscillospiraceae bacterium]